MSKRIKKLDIVIPTTQYGNLCGVLNNINYKDTANNTSNESASKENIESGQANNQGNNKESN